MGSAIVSPHALPVLLLQALLSCVALGADNSGSVTFYTGAAFTGVQRRVYFDSTDVCVNVQCVQDSVRSITWSQLYGDGSVNDETPTQIEFFAGADCTGVSTKYNTFAPTTPSEFAKKTVDHSVLSFAVHTEGTALQSLSVEAQCTVVEQPLDAKTTISFPGQLMLHDLPFEGGREASVPIAIAQRCYDIDVPSEFQLSSVSWTKMSDRSSLNRNGQSMVYLFNDPGCDGLRRRFFSLYNQTSGDFQSTGLTRLGSFMLMQSSPFVLGTPIKLKPTIDSSTFPTTASFGWVTLSAGRSSDSSLRERKYQVNKMETCYSLACFGSQATRAVWSNLPTEGSFHGRQDALIAFYSDTSCRNRQGSPVSISAGEINVTKSPDYEGFQSLMVWVNTNETSEPPIDDICDGSSTKQPNAQVPHESSDNAALLSGILVGAAAVGIVGVVFWYRRRLRSISDSKQQSLTSTCELDLDEAIRDNYITAADVRLVVCVSKTDNALVYSGIFTNQVVTVKQLGSTDDIARENFLYEVKVAAQLDHLKIVCLIGVYWTNSSHVFSVFEHMEGGDLSSFLAANRNNLSWARSSSPSSPSSPSADGADQVEGCLPTKLQLAIDVAEALVLLHSFSPPLIHGNLTSRSVWLTSSGTAKLWDFRPTEVETDRNSLTVRHAGSDDLFSFGALLLELDWCEPAPASSALMKARFTPCCPPKVVSLARRCFVECEFDRPSALEAYYELRKVLISSKRANEEK